MTATKTEKPQIVASAELEKLKDKFRDLARMNKKAPIVRLLAAISRASGNNGSISDAQKWVSKKDLMALKAKNEGLAKGTKGSITVRLISTLERLYGA